METSVEYVDECTAMETIGENVEAEVGDWVIVSYDSKIYPGKVTALSENVSKSNASSLSLWLEMARGGG